MKGYNKTIIIGRVSSEPELKQVDGHDLTSFTIYNSILDANGEELIEHHRIDALDKQANLCIKYLKKGDLCCVEGTIHFLSYNVNEETKCRQSIRCENLTFLRRRP